VNISVADRILIIISSAGSLSTSIFLIVIAATLPRVLVTDPKNLQKKKDNLHNRYLQYKNVHNILKCSTKPAAFTEDIPFHVIPINLSDEILWMYRGSPGLLSGF
jgi:hypothetical protein